MESGYQCYGTVDLYRSVRRDSWCVKWEYGEHLADSNLEILVDVVDVVLQGSGVDEKFLGITLFALVPNTTEFMNAISFALNGNIALRYARDFMP